MAKRNPIVSFQNILFRNVVLIQPGSYAGFAIKTKSVLLKIKGVMFDNFFDSIGRIYQVKFVKSKKVRFYVLHHCFHI